MTERIDGEPVATALIKCTNLRDGFSFFDPFFALFDQICSKTGFFGHICSVLIKFVQTGFC
jgi:hypothetical protein